MMLRNLSFHKPFILTALVLGLLATAGWTQQTLVGSYETHRWSVMFGGVSIDGTTTTQVNSGSAALELTFDADAGFAAIQTGEFISELGTGLSEGFSAYVYTEALSGATGTPQVKLEATSESNTGMAGADTTVTLDAFTSVTLPAGNLTANYKKLLLVLIPNGATGQFRICFDTVQREGAMWDDLESFNQPEVVPVNISGTARGEVTLAGATLATAGPSASEGTHAWGLTWDADDDGTVECRHNFNPGQDFSGKNYFNLDVYVPTGTDLPTFNLYFYDGSNGAYITGSAVTAHDVWETVQIDISSLASSSANPASITELVIVATGMTAGNGGTLFIDSAVADVPVELSGFEIQ